MTGEAACFGTVFHPAYMKRHQELRQQVLTHKLDAILDPRTQAAATPGGFTEALGKLPWGLGRQHTSDDFKDAGGRKLVVAEKKTREQRKRLDALRTALGHQVNKAPPRSFAYLPKTRIARDVQHRDAH